MNVALGRGRVEVMRLLVLQSAPDSSPHITSALHARGFVLDTFSKLIDGSEAVATGRYRAMLLDHRLADGCTVNWLRTRRASGLPTPALVLTSHDSEEDRIHALESGADDCVHKHGSVRELVARLRALVRRPPVMAVASLQYGNLLLDCSSRQVWVRSKPVLLPRRELNLLELLIRRQGLVVPRSALETDLYGHAEEICPNSIEVRVSRVRRRLKAAGADVTIQTVRGVGYCLIHGCRA